MKNLEHSQLVKEYKAQVVEYNNLVERVVKNKFEMKYLWKYKKDYPADWKRKAEMLSDDRDNMWRLKQSIMKLKAKIRECSSRPQE